jgi:hypothetical protein
MPESPAADDSRCPRCGQAFHCGIDDSGRCWCADITLPHGILSTLAQRYRSCLCSRCLRALAEAAPHARP